MVILFTSIEYLEGKKEVNILAGFLVLISMFLVSLFITLWSLKVSAGIAYEESSWKGAFIQLVVLIVIGVVLGVATNLLMGGIGFLSLA